MYNNILYEKLKIYTEQSFNECLYLVFCLLCFMLLSNSTLHLMFYTYICYWNTFQYKYITQITFHVVKQSRTQTTQKDICLLFIILFLYSFYSMKLSFSSSPQMFSIRCFKSTRKFLHELKAFPNISFVCFHWKITWHLGKIKKKVKLRESAIELTRRVWGSRVSASPVVYSLKRPINYFCRICTTLCMIFKERLFIETLCRPLFTKYAHYKPLFQFQNNALNNARIPHQHLGKSISLNKVLSNYGLTSTEQLFMERPLHDVSYPIFSTFCK